MDEFIKILQNYERRIDALERLVRLKDIQLPSNGSFVLPSYTADPGSPIEGQMWYNSTSLTIKVYTNGSIRTLDTTP